MHNHFFRERTHLETLGHTSSCIIETWFMHIGPTLVIIWMFVVPIRPVPDKRGTFRTWFDNLHSPAEFE